MTDESNEFFDEDEALEEELAGESPEYRYCRQLEQVRQWKWRHTWQGAFESSMRHYDACPADINDDALDAPSSWLTDHNQGARAIYRVAENIPDVDALARQAVRRLEAYSPKSVTVLKLIIANGSHRGRSIRELQTILGRGGRKAKYKMAENHYYYNLKKILNFFSPA